ncbi:excalibur calcium-binding domain-containing protein [Nocardia sp. GCM10030253]
MRKSRPVVLIIGALLVAVLVLSMSGCGKSKKRRNSTSSRPAATSTVTSTPQRPFKDCNEAWALGKPPLRRTDKGYSITLDKLDGAEDGVACAVRPTR